MNTSAIPSPYLPCLSGLSSVQYGTGEFSPRV
nr:MAG TPA: hypothetical protein [Caudoviricetes sp.]